MTTTVAFKLAEESWVSRARVKRNPDPSLYTKGSNSAPTFFNLLVQLVVQSLAEGTWLSDFRIQPHPFSVPSHHILARLLRHVVVTENLRCSRTVSRRGTVSDWLRTPLSVSKRPTHFPDEKS